MVRAQNVSFERVIVFRRGDSGSSLLARESVAAKARVKIVVPLSFRTCIFQLLNHSAARSQQVRITPNKFRPFKASRLCRSRFGSLFTGRIALVRQAAMFCYSREEEEEEIDRIWSSNHLACEKPF